MTGPTHLNVLSLTTVRLELISQVPEQSLPSATGFFCKYNGKVFLVTNHHVVSGINCPTGELLDQQYGRVPGRLEFDAWLGSIDCDGIDVGAQTERMIKFRFSVNLYNSGYPTWIEHPVHGASADVVAIQLTEKTLTTVLAENVSSPEMDYVEKIGSMVYFNLSQHMEANKFTVTDQVVIVGYPLLASESLTQFPIYKSGFVASEPDDPSDSRFYIDAKTKPGMSGSPVTMANLVASYNNSLDRGPTEQTTTLLGVYSGRNEQRKEEYEAELGIVWPIKEYLLPILDRVDS